jgi:phosphatidylethanolamine-binding protein (PEBP) family uncharacterized protein
LKPLFGSRHRGRRNIDQQGTNEPDAARPGVYNIPATATGLARGAGNSPATLPPGAYGGNTDFMDTGATGVNGNYGGPCPPVGDKPHRYIFTLFAVAVPSVQAAGGIPGTGSAALYGFVLNEGLGAALLGTASFTATYGR